MLHQITMFHNTIELTITDSTITCINSIGGLLEPSPVGADMKLMSNEAGAGL